MHCLKSLGKLGVLALKKSDFGVRGHPGDYASDCARGHNSLAQSPRLRARASWDHEPQNLHFHLLHQALGGFHLALSSFEDLKSYGSFWRPTCVLVGGFKLLVEVLGIFGLEDSSLFKGAQVGVKSRFSLNLASPVCYGSMSTFVFYPVLGRLVFHIEARSALDVM
ncbi:hypothetical protein L6452_43182 [Arctium lappa]|uniref:Uncharacterized protein n=1 Tax=Arctium lappa TaxID=4217 RepID=A0ACB8XKX0_ARCLA|nr:hypothetical protein L6452_43182 [Arctium lappa]